MTAFNSGPHAVVLSGGGAYAAYEVGVLKALFAGQSPATASTPVIPEIYTGTSAGAFNAAFLVSQTQLDAIQSVQALEQVWLHRLAGDPDGCSNGVARYRLDPFTIFDPNCFFRAPTRTVSQIADDVAFFARDWSERAVQFFSFPPDVPIEARLARLVDLSSFFAENLGTLIPSVIAFPDIPASPRKLAIAATNWTKGETEIYCNTDMASLNAPLYVKASAAIPGVFPRVKIGADFYVDGGVLMNTPLKPAIALEAGTLHVIYMDPDISKIPVDRLQNTLDTIDRIFQIQNAKVLNTDIENAARVNRGLELARSQFSGLTGTDQNILGRFLGQASRNIEAAGQGARENISFVDRYNQLTIHRYHPADDLGGLLGFLRFERPNIEALIQIGYDNALHHDCDKEGCIGPDGLTVRIRKIARQS
jgi:NTE family protein